MVDKRDRKGLMNCLEQNSKVSIKDIIDHKGYTLLHLACFKNLDEIAYHLVKRAKLTLSQQVLV